MVSVLTVNGSDNTGWSGLQLDVKTISEMGGHVLTAATCLVHHSHAGIQGVTHLPSRLLSTQIENTTSEFSPQAVKVGLLPTQEAVVAVSRTIAGCPNIVLSPGILSSQGRALVDRAVLSSICRHLLPMADLVSLRCNEAELLLSTQITTDADMLLSAGKLCTLGAKAVLLRGGRTVHGRLTALLYISPTSQQRREDKRKVGKQAQEEDYQFFCSTNVSGWQQHGVGGALSAAIATRLALGDDIRQATRNAHSYIRSRIVYSVAQDKPVGRPVQICDSFLALLSAHYSEAHDVSFYARHLAIGERYLSHVTDMVMGKSPKQIIREYLLDEARRKLTTTDLSIKEISAQLGFPTLSRFCRFFTQQSGSTPTKYRLSDK